MVMARLRDWAAKLFWDVLSNALWGAIGSGTMIAAAVSLFGHFTSHPIWLERGATALVTCIVIIVLTLIISVGRRLMHRSSDTIPDSNTEPRLLHLSRPEGKLGEMHDWLADTQHQFAQLRSAYSRLIDDWNQWIRAAQEASDRQMKEQSTWERVFPEAISGAYRTEIAVSTSIFIRRLEDLHNRIEKAFGQA
jgi:hypothetical protein